MLLLNITTADPRLLQRDLS